MHIALLTLKETIEGEMNGETVEIGINSALLEFERKADEYGTGIVGAPANDLLGYEGVEGAVGPRFRKLSKEVHASGDAIPSALILRYALRATLFLLLLTSIWYCETHLEGTMLILATRAGDRRLPYESVMGE